MSEDILPSSYRWFHEIGDAISGVMQKGLKKAFERADYRIFTQGMKIEFDRGPDLEPFCQIYNPMGHETEKFIESANPRLVAQMIGMMALRIKELEENK